MLNFDDVLIVPQFSHVRSRKDVDVSTEFLGKRVALPVINSNMDSVASPALCRALASYGVQGSLHRFWSIEQNVQAFKDSVFNNIKPIVSVGIGMKELDRADALVAAGADVLMLDVAHAANIAVVEQYAMLLGRNYFPKVKFIVGDFGTGAEIREFYRQLIKQTNPSGYYDGMHPPLHAVKVGIGIGSVCQTRLVTGVGSTTISCIRDCADATNELGISLILDGGVKHVGDISKALVAGADMVMSGALFAGTDEAAGQFVNTPTGKFKEYRGSASYESYVVQSKIASWRAPEGRVEMVPYKGPVSTILDTINGGLRSACSYVNSFNIDELKAKADFAFNDKRIHETI